MSLLYQYTELNDVLPTYVYMYIHAHLIFTYIVPEATSSQLVALLRQLFFLQIVLVEPFFDCYKPMSVIAGAKPLFVPLRPVCVVLFHLIIWSASFTVL